MPNVPGLPKYTQPLIESSGNTATPWYRYFSNLANTAGNIAELQQEIDALTAEVAAIPQGTQVRGTLSIAQTGTPAPGGIIFLSLQGDVAAPGDHYRYGTDGSGNKGWATVFSDFAASTNIAPSASGTGVVSFDLTDVTVTAGGSLKKYAFDAKGRLSQQANATTDDLTEGTTNLYFTKPRVGAALSAGAGITITTDPGTGISTIAESALTIPNLTDQTGVNLTDQASVILTANGTTAGIPIMASYTLGTLPSAATYTHGMIYVSDLSGSPAPCYSDGTNWRRFSDNTIAS